MIQLRGLRKTFGAVVALDGVSFAVAAGQVVGLLGPNGAGKTTCLRLLAGLLAPDAGEVRVSGLELPAQSLAVRRLLGYLPEGAPAYPELRVSEHLAARARLRQIPRRACPAELERLIAVCGLGPVRRRLVGQLSRGYRQRLGLAEALLGSPPLLVLDEPTAGLDPAGIREVRELVRSLGGAHTILFSTHQLAEVEAVCQRVVILHQGRVAADSPLASLRSTPGRDAWVVRARPAGAPEGLVVALRAVDGVIAVALLDPASGAAEAPVTLRVETGSEPEMGETIAAAVQGAGGALQELRREAPRLEDVFHGLTDGAGGASER